MRNMSVSWKQTFMYPKWLYNYLKVDPKWSKVPFIRQKTSQSDPKVIPKWSQTYKWKSKVRHRNLYFQFLDPLGSTSYTIVAAKWQQSYLKWPSYAKVAPTWAQSADFLRINRNFQWFVLPHSFIKPLKYVGNMSVSWKQTFVYPKWLHNYLKVDPKWSQITFIYQKWPQRDPKVTLKWPQSQPKVT